MRDVNCTKEQLLDTSAKILRVAEEDPQAAAVYAIDSLDAILSDEQLYALLKVRRQIGHPILRSGLVAIAKDRGMKVPR